ncbi:DUF805 domain-containing protein [Microbacterium sp. X-17]|uniref:DUF805 domain-containing protein n=1 Tax=Microbacterium sp. X-17 TaxID=3144404 RepID=UPI0031F50051
MSTPPAAPLWAPLYSANMGDAIRRFFTKYADFTGRASRSEYWWFFLFDVLLAIVYWTFVVVIGRLSGSLGMTGSTRAVGPLFWVLLAVWIVWVFATLVPHLALVWRRLHDANLAGPLYFISFAPFGWVVLLVLTALPPNPVGARFDRPR